MDKEKLEEGRIKRANEERESEKDWEREKEKELMKEESKREGENVKVFFFKFKVLIFSLSFFLSFRVCV